MQRARCLRPANPLFFLALAATGRGDWFAADHLVTTDAKVPAQVRIPVPDAQDDDGSACTTADACKGGACQGGAVKACNDAEPCTADACEAKTGACTHDGAAQDGAACGGTCGHAAQACGKRFQAGWGGNANDDFAAIRASGSGWVAAGQTASYGSGGDGLLVAMDGCGTVQWSRTFGGSGKGKFTSVEPTPDGGWILAGESTTGDVSGDAWVVKVDGSGKKQWSLMHGGTGYDLAQSAVATSDGGYVVAAKTYSFGPGTPTLHNGLLFKLSGSGSVMWSKVLASNSGSMDAVQMREVKDGGYVLVGGSEGFGQGADDVWLTKLGADGSHGWMPGWCARGQTGRWAARTRQQVSAASRKPWLRNRFRQSRWLPARWLRMRPAGAAEQSADVPGRSRTGRPGADLVPKILNSFRLPTAFHPAA